MNNSIYSKLDIPDTDRLTSIKQEEAEFIFSFLQENKITSTLEIGLAYGCSAAYILSATKSLHYAIDPFQERYNNLGLKNIKQMGLDGLLQLEKGCSNVILPKLLLQGGKFDFIFIDGAHKYDDIFVDFYYADLLLNQNGYILFHDIWMRSTQMVCAWINTNKSNYNFCPTPPLNFALYQKKGSDNRSWNHFNEFNSVSIARFLKNMIYRIMAGRKNGTE
jgi:hypothetical protein